jgi:hypothetical protein
MCDRLRLISAVITVRTMPAVSDTGTVCKSLSSPCRLPATMSTTCLAGGVFLVALLGSVQVGGLGAAGEQKRSGKRHKEA